MRIRFAINLLALLAIVMLASYIAGQDPITFISMNSEAVLFLLVLTLVVYLILRKTEGTP